MRNARDGATIIEFAIVAPVLFLLVIGMLEAGMIMFTMSVLEGATSIGSRTGKTGFNGGGGSREDFIRAQITELSGGYLDPSLLDISILSYTAFSNIGQPEPCTHPNDAPPCPGGFVDINGNGTWDADMGRDNPGGGGEVVLYRVTYPWALFTPMLGSLMGDANGILNLTAVATVRNEPFPGGV